MTVPPFWFRDRTFDPAAGPVLMGVVNASPESFSDGAESVTVDQQLTRAQILLDAGADLLDIGGESGVTNRVALSPEEEADRVVPLVRELVAAGVTVSVDTWKAPVAAAVLDSGAHCINDVSGLRDPVLAELCAAVGAGLVIMHTRAEPKVKAFPHYADVVADVVTFLSAKVAEAEAAGLARDRIVLDPGPDFAKTPSQTITVLRHLGALEPLGLPVLLAVSRKDFVGALTGRRPRARLAGTLAAVGAGVDAGAAILRVHDVGDVADYLTVRRALRGEADVPDDLHLDESLRREPTG